MSSPFLGLLRYGWANDPAGQRAVYELITSRVKARQCTDPDDATQTIALKIFGSAEKAYLLVLKLAEQSAALDAALAAAPRGAMPTLDEALVASCDSQLSGYVSRMAEHYKIDRWRRRRRTVSLPEQDVLPAPFAALDDDSGVLTLRDRVLERVAADERRPEWLDRALGEVQALAEARSTMDDVIAACIASDADLGRLGGAEARTRARNRLQQQHKRAREYLLAAIRGAVSDGDLTADEGQVAERWVGMLIRRQKRKPAASRGQGHENR